MWKITVRKSKERLEKLRRKNQKKRNEKKRKRKGKRGGKEWEIVKKTKVWKVTLRKGGAGIQLSSFPGYESESGNHRWARGFTCPIKREGEEGRCDSSLANGLLML